MQEQMNDMRKKGIIVESSSSWLAPAVYTRKKTDCVWTTVKQTRGQERTHDRLSGANVFSKLDFQCGTGKYQWTQEKTAFSPGPGMRLFQFTRMPFGLCGAPSTFQRLMDVDARTAICHHLHRWHSAPLSERGAAQEPSGASIPMIERGTSEEASVRLEWHSWHTLCTPSPDSSKVEVVVNWPRPKDEAEVRRFLGLASYYCKYIDKFADIAAPLHQLTQKDTPFQWT